MAVPSRPPPDASLAARLHLAAENRDLISLALARAAGGDVVVLLLDTRDGLARELTVAIVEKGGKLDLDDREAGVLTPAVVADCTGLPVALVPAPGADSG